MSGENGQDNRLPGERLRAQRERRGLTLPQVASELHVNQRMLAALEADDYTELGAPIFVKGHLRNYARLLGMDAAELVAAYESAQQPSDPTLVAHRSEGVRVDEHRQHAWVGWLTWVFLLLLAALLAGWWWYQQEGGGELSFTRQPSERVELPAAAQSLPARDEAELSEEGMETTAEGLSPQDQMSSEQEESGTTAGSLGDAAVSPSPAESSVTREPAPATQSRTTLPPTREPSAPPAPPRNALVLEFAEESWVEIYDAEGRPILYDLLGAGARREINASGQLRVFLGNAGGVTVTVGGDRFDLARHVRADNTARFTVNVPAAD